MRGETCNGYDRLAERCTSNGWIKNQYCQQACSDAGFAYDGVVCSDTYYPYYYYYYYYYYD
jgi:hypothetical protein